MIIQIIILAILIMGVIQFCNINTRNGYKNLNISRDVNAKMVTIGEKFSMTIKIENNKGMPIMFMLIEQKIPEELVFSDIGAATVIGNENWHVSRYTMGKYQRRNRTYAMYGNKRGAYILRALNLKIGDPLGLSIESKELDNWIEVLISPKIKSMESLKFDNTSFMGDNTVRRWIHNDPLYIKGIREYTVEDRMKDINWKASLKADKLMVKDYDYTSDDQLVIIVNVQCGDPYWGYLSDELVDKAIDVAVALSCKALKESIPTGVWSNGNIIYCKDSGALDLAPRRGAMEEILEYCTRIYKVPRQEFSIYLQNRFAYLNEYTTYVIIACYLNENDRRIIMEVARKGYKIKIIDVSEQGDIENIKAVEKICYNGEAR